MNYKLLNEESSDGKSIDNNDMSSIYNLMKVILEAIYRDETIVCV